MYKNIVFFITSFGHGKGGHFFSLKIISEALNKHYKCLIISVGPGFSPTIKSINKLNVLHFTFNGVKIVSTLNDIEQEVSKRYNGEKCIYHAFDRYAYLFARVLANRKNTPSVLTKCGGPNPKDFFPHTNNLILFSKENYNFFKNNKKFRNTNIEIIPNRVNKVQTNKNRIQLLLKQLSLDSNKKIILKIGRINEHYIDTIFQTISLHQALLKENIDINLLLIGVIQNKNSYEKLNVGLPEKVYMVTDNRFTESASELIDIADIVVGTGRGLMEACSLGKVVLTPNKNSKFPILVTSENIEKLLASNFSPRNNVSFNDTETISILKEVVTNPALLEDYIKKSYQYFDRFFNINSAIESYNNFYNRLQLQLKPKHIDIGLNYFRYIIRLIQTKLNFLK